MSYKTNPISIRLGINRGWKWLQYSEKRKEYILINEFNIKLYLYLKSILFIKKYHLIKYVLRNCIENMKHLTLMLFRTLQPSRDKTKKRKKYRLYGYGGKLRWRVLEEKRNKVLLSRYQYKKKLLHMYNNFLTIKSYCVYKYNNSYKEKVILVNSEDEYIIKRFREEKMEKKESVYVELLKKKYLQIERTIKTIKAFIVEKKAMKIFKIKEEEEKIKKIKERIKEILVIIRQESEKSMRTKNAMSNHQYIPYHKEKAISKLRTEKKRVFCNKGIKEYINMVCKFRIKYLLEELISRNFPIMPIIEIENILDGQKNKYKVMQKQKSEKLLPNERAKYLLTKSKEGKEVIELEQSNWSKIIEKEAKQDKFAALLRKRWKLYKVLKDWAPYIVNFKLNLDPMPIMENIVYHYEHVRKYYAVIQNMGDVLKRLISKRNRKGGIKLIVYGKLRKRKGRATSKILRAHKSPSNQQFWQKINYIYSAATTKKGTYGFKCWVKL